MGEIYRRRFISRARKSRGIIIKIEVSPTGDRDVPFVTVEYTTEKTRIYQYTTSYQSILPKHVGDHINVYYDPKKPDEDVIIGNPLISFELFFGLVFLGYSIYLFIKYLK